MATSETTNPPTSSSSSWPHPDDGICQKIECTPCQNRILKITCKFFQGEYRKMLKAQFERANMCEDIKCKICSYEHPEKMTCPGCNSPFGKKREGLLALEVGQIHTVVEHINMNGNIKPCDCIVHMKFYVICSSECHKKSIFKETVHQGNFTYSNPKGGPEIPTSGPVCTTRNYAAGKEAVSAVPHKLDSTTAPSSSSSSSSPPSTPAPSSSNPADSSSGNKCAVCKKGAVTKCSRCKTTYYCSQPCQKEDWKTHKNTCVPAK